MSRIRGMSVMGLVWAATACGTDSDTGSVDVATVSAGQDVDPDGYLVELIGTGTVSIGSNGTARFPEVPAGDHEVRLTAVRGNCHVQRAHPRLIRVVAGETFQLHFEVACAHAPLLGRMVISRARGDSSHIYAMNPDGTSQYRLGTTELWELFPSISPDGTRILFFGYVRYESDFREFGHVYVMNADGSGLVALTDDDADDADPVWSPDGARIAFVREVHDEFANYDIYAMDADGTSLLNVTRSPGEYEFSPAWSPDGRRILFLGGPVDEVAEYYVINPDGTGRSRITNDATVKGSATWSPDGSRIVFSADPEGKGDDLYVMDADGSDRVQLTSLPGTEWTPSWSPDGSRIVFTYLDHLTAQFDLYTVNPDGTGLTNISNTADVSERIGVHPWGP